MLVKFAQAILLLSPVWMTILLSPMKALLPGVRDENMSVILIPWFVSPCTLRCMWWCRDKTHVALNSPPAVTLPAFPLTSPIWQKSFLDLSHMQSAEMA